MIPLFIYFFLFDKTHYWVTHYSLIIQLAWMAAQTLKHLTNIDRSSASRSIHYPIHQLIPASQHLSPFEQNINTSLFKDAKKKIVDKIVGFLLEAGPGLAFGLGIYTWGNWEYARTHYNHRA